MAEKEPETIFLKPSEFGTLTIYADGSVRFGDVGPLSFGVLKEIYEEALAKRTQKVKSGTEYFQEVICQLDALEADPELINDTASNALGYSGTMYALSWFCLDRINDLIGRVVLLEDAEKRREDQSSRT